MFDFHTLKIWQRSLALAAAVARATKGRGRDGSRGLVSQLTRACNSMHANIAEAAGKDTPKDSAHFLDISIGSQNEVESHLAEAAATGVLPRALTDQFTAEVQEIRRMTVGFKRWVLSRDK